MDKVCLITDKYDFSKDNYQYILFISNKIDKVGCVNIHSIYKPLFSINEISLVTPYFKLLYENDLYKFDFKCNRFNLSKLDIDFIKHYNIVFPMEFSVLDVLDNYIIDIENKDYLKNVLLMCSVFNKKYKLIGDNNE